MLFFFFKEQIKLYSQVFQFIAKYSVQQHLYVKNIRYNHMKYKHRYIVDIV